LKWIGCVIMLNFTRPFFVEPTLLERNNARLSHSTIRGNHENSRLKLSAAVSKSPNSALKNRLRAPATKTFADCDFRTSVTPPSLNIE
jgi:hypothetical protein